MDRPRSAATLSSVFSIATAIAFVTTLAVFAPAARAHDWNGFVADRAGNLFAVDAEDGFIWKITADGKAKTFVDTERSKELNHPHHLEIDGDDHLWLTGG